MHALGARHKPSRLDLNAVSDGFAELIPKSSVPNRVFVCMIGKCSESFRKGKPKWWSN
jgi:hypothetical protein